MKAKRAGVGEALRQRLVARFESALDRGDRAKASRLLDEALAQVGWSADDVELLHMQAQWAWESQGPAAALPWYQRLVAADADDADAHHALGVLHLELGSHDAALVHFHRVLQLDRATDSLDSRPWIEELVVQRVHRLLKRLPSSIAAQVRDLPVVLEERPAVALVDEGFDPRALGLFEGNDMRASFDALQSPTRIVLYLANLVAAFPSMPALLRQVDITVLHELGHFLGLDEDEVEALGLG